MEKHDNFEDAPKINVDEFFGEDWNKYINARTDFAQTGSNDAYDRMNEAAISMVTPETLRDYINDVDEEYTRTLLDNLTFIDKILEGTKVDEWTETQIELARYFLQFDPDTTIHEVELLTPHGIQLAWKRRRYLGATK